MLQTSGKIQIIHDEIESWKNTQYILEARLRVNKKIGDASQVEKLTSDLVKVEEAIMEYENILKELQREDPTVESA